MISNKYKISEEFPKILYNFTKAIMHYKPKDILDFSIKYFYSLEKKIPLTSILENKITIEQNINKRETISSTIDIEPTQINTRNNIKKNNSETISQNNDDEDENKIDKLEDSAINIVPMSPELEEFVKGKDDEERPHSALSGVPEAEKKNIKDFVADLFLDINLEEN